MKFCTARRLVISLGQVRFCQTKNTLEPGLAPCRPAHSLFSSSFKSFYFTMQSHSQQAPMLSLPPELLQCLIFPQLPAPCLLACLFVSQQFRKIVLSTSSIEITLSNIQQQSLLAGLYRLGSVPLLEWFNKYLKYPVLCLPNKNKCLLAAAEG